MAGNDTRSFILTIAVAHLEHPRHRAVHEVIELAEAGDQRRDSPLDRPDVEDLRDQRVAGLGASHRDRAGRAD